MNTRMSWSREEKLVRRELAALIWTLNRLSGKVARISWDHYLRKSHIENDPDINKDFDRISQKR